MIPGVILFVFISCVVSKYTYALEKSMPIKPSGKAIKSERGDG